MLLGVPIVKVQEMIRYLEITKVPLAPLYVAGLINLRGKIVTVVDLRVRLGFPERTKAEKPMNLVLSGQSPVSLLVDVIGDVVEVGEDVFEKPPNMAKNQASRLLRGIYKLDSEILHILDIEQTLDFNGTGKPETYNSNDSTKPNSSADAGVV
jgi:purine-binding chemotaxis protein CheW